MNSSHFAEIVGPHLGRLYRLAFRLTASAADAEDLVQEVLIKAHERSSELTGIVELGPWLSRVLYNRFVDDVRRYRRARMRVVPLASSDESGFVGVEALASEDPDPEAIADHEFDISRLNAALDQLSLEHRAVVLMHDAEGYKLQEIHVITGIPVGTLKSRLHRARARLREILAEDGTF